MSWFMRQRQDFIRAQLETFGQIRRADITKRFEVTTQVASSDIATFIEQHPDAIEYDRSAKCYTFDGAALSSDPAGEGGVLPVGALVEYRNEEADISLAAEIVSHEEGRYNLRLSDGSCCIARPSRVSRATLNAATGEKEKG